MLPCRRLGLRCLIYDKEEGMDKIVIEALGYVNSVREAFGLRPIHTEEDLIEEGETPWLAGAVRGAIARCVEGGYAGDRVTVSYPKWWDRAMTLGQTLGTKAVYDYVVDRYAARVPLPKDLLDILVQLRKLQRGD